MASVLDAAVQMPLVERCYARIGLMGNPSDGFGGKTVSFLINNFFASCTIQGSTDNNIHLIPHPVYDPTSFSSLADLNAHTLANGYYGGMRLLQATCRVFFDFLVRNSLSDRSKTYGGFTMSYDTNIPRCVGLSGSSAIIVAAFRCLLRFHGNLTLDELGISKDIFPSIILSIEKSELKISAGLQDRVIQTYGGLVHMDFTITSQIARAPSNIAMKTLTQLNKPGGIYTPLDPGMLPDMYLAYNVNVGKGGDSGTVHNTVQERWAQQDPDLVRNMLELGSYADRSVLALKARDYSTLGALMDMNFAMRRRIYGDEVVGAKNIAVIELAKSFGMSAKFTGSGGGILCMRVTAEYSLETPLSHVHSATCIPGTFFDDIQEEIVRSAFRPLGFEFVRITIPTTLSP